MGYGEIDKGYVTNYANFVKDTPSYESINVRIAESNSTKPGWWEDGKKNL